MFENNRHRDHDIKTRSDVYVGKGNFQFKWRSEI